MPIVNSNKNARPDILKRAENIAAIFQKTTGINCSAYSIDPHQIELYPECECAFCLHLQSITGGKTNCRKMYVYAAHQADILGGQYIFMCPKGFYHFAAPLRDHSQLIGLLFGGPIVMTDRSELLTNEIFHDFDFNEEQKRQLQNCISSIPEISPEKVRNLADLLSILADELNGEHRIEESKRLLLQQSDISTVIHEIKNLKQVGAYPIEKEEELFSHIEKGNGEQARHILNELLGIIFFTSGGEFDIIKARITELIVLLSRSAMRGGADSDIIFGMNYQYIREISAFSNVEQLSRWLTQVMNRFTERVIDASSRRAGVLESSLKYIRANYASKISLEEAAEKAFLTPVYFSRLFKKNMGHTFSDYVNILRVDLAGRLLLNDQLTLSDVAQLSGFNDQSYFSKVFKAHTGMSPKKYKTDKIRIIKEANVL